MFSQLNRYSDHGCFTIKKSANLRQVCNAPKKPGVYLIYSLHKGSIDLLYIGTSGLVLQNGTFKNQSLFGRLNNRQRGMSRQQFFQEEIVLNGYEALQVNWFVTFDDTIQHLPSFVEATLLQVYFETFHRLPPWNKKF